MQLTSEENRRIHEIINLIAVSCEFGVFDRIDGMCQQLLIELLLHSDARPLRNEDEVRIQKVASYIQTHFTEDIDLDELARHFGFSTRSFYRHRSNYHERSPHEYGSGLKLAEPKRLLLESVLPVEDISKRLNYDSSTYFVNLFRKHNKITPLQYRKKNESLIVFG